jgi:hypothetical protein
MEGRGLASRGGNTIVSCIRGRSDSCYPAVGFTICDISTQSAGKSSEVIKCMMDVVNIITDDFTGISVRKRSTELVMDYWLTVSMLVKYEHTESIIFMFFGTCVTS